MRYILAWLAFMAIGLASITTSAWAKSVRPALAGEANVLAEWRKAENRRDCAPIAFADIGTPAGTPRRAYFGGGWGVAFDLPGQRSAYGVAGAGLLPGDEDAMAAKRQDLIGQWPYFRDLGELPQPAFAGYGLEGAKAYAPENPSGNGDHSLAYVRVAGQKCLYNVWSRLGRRHLERLLDGLRLVPRQAPVHKR